MSGSLRVMRFKFTLRLITAETYPVANLLNHSSEPVRTTTDFFVLPPVLLHIHGFHGTAL